MGVFEKILNESIIDYILRLSSAKKYDKSITWQSIADNIAIQYGLERSEAWVRNIVKKSSCCDCEYSNCNGYEQKDLFSMVESSISDKTLEMKKERIKLAEERAQNNAYIRKMAREETIKEIALNCAEKMSSKKMLTSYKPHEESKHNNKDEREAICCISDWHYGLEFKNPWNEFSPEICRDRVSILKNKVINYIRKNKCKVLHLVNLQDLIAGRIHLGLRLESRFDVITQTLDVSEILAEFITSISKYVKVKYYDCLDNHSRLEPNKKEAQDLESLARIIPWYLKERLKNNLNVEICENEYGHDIITFNTLGHSIVAVHGDKERSSNLIQRMNSFMGMNYNLILMGHQHHFFMDEQCSTLLSGNGSLMGTDTHAKNLRLNSIPSQNLIIVSKENVMEVLYRIPV